MRLSTGYIAAQGKIHTKVSINTEEEEIDGFRIRFPFLGSVPFLLFNLKFDMGQKAHG